MAANKIQKLQQPFYWLDLAHVDYFLLLRTKEELVDIVLTLGSLMKIWDGVHRNIVIDSFAVAFRR
jgi:hypothetical protein